jgi:hypothetical protein
MGSQFFKGKAPSAGSISGGNPGLEARAIGAATYGGRGAAIGAQKGLSSAEKIDNAMRPGPLKRSAAYPKGPKV